jgi:hypothetical protein
MYVALSDLIPEYLDDEYIQYLIDDLEKYTNEYTYEE